MMLLATLNDTAAADMDAQAARAAAAGVYWLELRSAWRTSIAELDDARLQTVAGVMSRRGVRAACVDVPHRSPDDDTSRPLERLREVFNRAAAIAGTVGAPFVRLMGGLGEPDDESRGALERWLEFFRRCAGHAARAGAAVLVEPYAGGCVGTPDAGRAIAPALRAAGARALYDPRRFSSGGESAAEAMADAVLPLLAYVRVDAASVERWGRAGGMLERIIRGMHRRDCFVCVEWNPTATAGGRASEAESPAAYAEAVRRAGRLIGRGAVDAVSDVERSPQEERQ